MEDQHTINLITGEIVRLITPNGGNYSRAMRKYGQQNEFDMLPFLMEEMCEVDGNKRTHKFFVEMFCDDYIKIAELLNGLTTIR